MVAGFLFGIKTSPAPLLITDANQNGIWDDVEFSLNKEYKAWPHLQPASLEMGKIVQKILENPNADDILEQDRIFARIISCVIASGMRDGLSLDESSEHVSKIRDLILTNKVRQEKWIKYNAAITGHLLTFDEPSMGKCPSHIRNL